MGTKNKPGAFDCYANAAPDEPMFILLGRDKHAAGLVRLWALLRQRDSEDAVKIAEALQCAKAMDDWARSLGKNPVDNDAEFEKFYIVATEGMAEHPEEFDSACACDLCCSYG